jgi:NADH-quinone oxidoreductase subunit N
MNPIFASDSLSLFAPFLSVSAAIAFLIGGHIARWSTTIILSLVGLALGFAWFIGFYSPPTGLSSWGISFDALGTLGTQLLLPAIFLVAIMAMDLTEYDRKIGSLLLVLLSGIGAIAVLISHNWMILFVAIQCMSIPIYALIARDTNNPNAVSASLRYLLLSALAMAFMLFGILLLYAATGTLDFHEQAAVMQPSSLLILGFALVLVGLGFKLSVFPLHIWTPQVYQNSPFFVVGLMVVIAKSAVMIALLRAFLVVFATPPSAFIAVLSAMAIISMWLGNGLMLKEKRFIALLAFLSIGHMGFLLVALLAKNQLGIEAIFSDITAFGLALLIILASIKSLDKRWSAHFTIDEFRGLVRQHPTHALVLILALISLAGFPLTAGFIGKYSVFMASIEAHLWFFIPHMAITSILGLCALARIIIVMFELPVENSVSKTSISIPLVVGALALLAFGIFPETWLLWVKSQSAGLNLLK